MFGIGPQELVIIGLLALLIFGPGKLPGVARDVGGFVRRAQSSMDGFKSEFALPKSPRSGEPAKREDKRRSNSSSAAVSHKGHAPAAIEGDTHKFGADVEKTHRRAPTSVER